MCEIILVIKVQIDALVSLTLHLFAISDARFSLALPPILSGPLFRRAVAPIRHDLQRRHYHRHSHHIAVWNNVKIAQQNNVQNQHTMTHTIFRYNRCDDDSLRTFMEQHKDNKDPRDDLRFQRFGETVPAQQVTLPEIEIVNVSRDKIKQLVTRS